MVLCYFILLDKFLASRWFVSHSLELEKLYKMVWLLGRTKDDQCVTTGTIPWKIEKNPWNPGSHLLYFIRQLSCFKMVCISFDRAWKALQNAMISKSRKRWPVFENRDNTVENRKKFLKTQVSFYYIVQDTFLASRWLVSDSTELEKFYKLVLFPSREKDDQCVTTGTIQQKIRKSP